MRPSIRTVVRQLTPPIVLTLKRAIFDRAPSVAADANRVALRAAHDELNRDLPENSMRLRPGIVLGLHPESREAFEAFCWRYPEMVVELDEFIARTVGKRRLLDIGALHGIFSLVFSCGDPGRRSVAVDASPIAFARLLYNVHKNRPANIVPIECAMSAESGVVRMHYEWEHAVAAGTTADGSAGVTVETRTGDELCASLDFEPDVIKIDVEGHEVKVLRGLRGMLRRCRPLIFLEIHPDRIREESDRLEDLIGLLREAGYRAESAGGGALPLEAIADLATDHRAILTPVENGNPD